MVHNQQNTYRQLIDDFIQDTGFTDEEAIPILDEFLVILPDLIVALQHEIKQGDLEKAVFQAHSIKGSAGNLRIMVLYELMKEMEMLLKNGDTGHISIIIDAVWEFYESIKKPD